MKNKLIIICILLATCFTSSSYAGKHSALGGAAIGAIAGVMLGAAIANNSQHTTHTYHTDYVYAPAYSNCYTERVEVVRPVRPVVETRRVYTQPVRERVVTHHYNRPVRHYTTEVCHSEPVYQTTEYCYAY